MIYLLSILLFAVWFAVFTQWKKIRAVKAYEKGAAEELNDFIVLTKKFHDNENKLNELLAELRDNKNAPNSRMVVYEFLQKYDSDFIKNTSTNLSRIINQAQPNPFHNLFSALNKYREIDVDTNDYREHYENCYP